jgi:plastocyanin
MPREARLAVVAAAMSFLAGGIRAELVTLPAAASLAGVSPFFSDVRVFNRSYTASLDVTGRYRCFVPSPCPGGGVIEIRFTLVPRESRAFDDIVAQTFLAPGTAGAVELEHGSAEGDLVVTSRLYATSPRPTVGMFIPGLKSGDAHALSVLTSVRNGGPGAGFRTNVGVFNGGVEAVDVTFRIFDGGAGVGAPIARTVAARSGIQVSGVFGAAGVAGHSTDNAVVVVSSSGAVFSYAAVIDNATADPVFVLGAADSAAPAPSPTPARLRRVAVGPGFQFRDEAEGGATSTIPAGTTVEWVWEGGGHSTTSGPCGANGCTADGVWNSGVKTDGVFRFRFDEPGTFPYFCDPHSDQMRGVVIVSPP